MRRFGSDVVCLGTGVKQPIRAKELAAVSEFLHLALSSTDITEYQRALLQNDAMLTILSCTSLANILAAADQRQVTLHGLLDMSAAFDCVDHDLLLQRLHYSFGMTGVVLDWISCFLRERTQRIVFNGQLSTTQHLAFGVPQGSVIGPLLYVLYTAKLSCVVAEHGLRLHQYADDSQIYISVALRDAAFY